MTARRAPVGLVVTSSSEQAAAAFRVHNLPNGAPTEPPAPGLQRLPGYWLQPSAVYGGECFDEFGALDDGPAAGGGAAFHGRALLYHPLFFLYGEPLMKYTGRVKMNRDFATHG